MRRQTIAMFNLNATKRDPRVLRIGRSLVGARHRVVVFEMLASDETEQGVIDGLEIRRVPVPTRYEAEDMAEFHAVCQPAFNIIERCDARVAGDARDVGRHGATGRLWDAVERQWRQRFPKAAFEPEQDRGDILGIRSIMLINLALYKVAELSSNPCPLQ